MVAHTFNPCTWEIHTFNPSTTEGELGVICLGEERNIRQKETRAQMQSVVGTAVSLRIRGDRVVPSD